MTAMQPTILAQRFTVEEFLAFYAGRPDGERWQLIDGVAMMMQGVLLGVATSAQWRWDHKTVFSLLAWLVFAALLAGRHWQGWRGQRATRWLYAGAVLLLLAYVGSRFVFEVILGRGVA